MFSGASATGLSAAANAGLRDAMNAKTPGTQLSRLNTAANHIQASMQSDRRALSSPRNSSTNNNPRSTAVRLAAEKNLRSVITQNTGTLRAAQRVANTQSTNLRKSQRDHDASLRVAQAALRKAKNAEKICKKTVAATKQISTISKPRTRRALQKSKSRSRGAPKALLLTSLRRCLSKAQHSNNNANVRVDRLAIRVKRLKKQRDTTNRAVHKFASQCARANAAIRRAKARYQKACGSLK